MYYPIGQINRSSITISIVPFIKDENFQRYLGRMKTVLISYIPANYYIYSFFLIAKYEQILILITKCYKLN